MDPSGEARMEDQIGKVAHKLCPPVTLNKINEEETCKNQESGLARADKQKKHYLFLMRTGWKEQRRKLFARVKFLKNNCE